MPYINKPKKQRGIKTDKEKNRRKIYSSQLWQNMRISYLQQHPLCEVCEMEGKTKLAEHCHHLISFLDVPKELMMQYAYDSNNFCSVCVNCHNRIHNGDLKGCVTKEQIRNKINNGKGSI